MFENPPVPSQIVPAITALVAVAAVVLTYLQFFRKPKPQPVPHVTVPPSGKPRILIVDDDRSFAASLALTLNGDYDVMACTRPADAEHAITNARDQEKPFSVALIDYNMPQWPGTDLIATLRVNQPHCYVILISGAFVEDGKGKPDAFWLKDPLKIGAWKAQIDAITQGA